jgi:hypothetical protein
VVKHVNLKTLSQTSLFISWYSCTEHILCCF